MSASTLELEQLSPLRVTLGRLLAVRQTKFQTTWHDRQMGISIHPRQPENLPPWQLTLEVNGHPLDAFISNKLLDHLLPEDMDHRIADELPDDLFLAALTFAMTPLLQEVSQRLGTGILLTGFEQSDVSMMLPTLGLDMSIDGISTQIQLELNDLLLAIINSLPAHQTAIMPDIPFWASLELGRTRVPDADLRSLATGDVVFLDEHISGQQLIIRVNRHIAFLAEAEGTRITIKQRLQTMDDQAPAENQAPEEAGVNLNDLAVDLTFEVGQQQMSAAELQGLQSGYVFELDRPIEQPVRVRANGKMIAECSLVQIDNRLGARITRLVD
ncbi:MAG: type III secretion system cytoplasmic ring protein SctQ [Endozoicomonas sp.]